MWTNVPRRGAIRAAASTAPWQAKPPAFCPRYRRSTVAAAPGVVLCVADGIVRIVVHVVAGEDLGGRRRRIDRLIGVAAGERERRNRQDDQDPHSRPPSSRETRPARRRVGALGDRVH
jgi:hypothetical protein